MAFGRRRGQSWEKANPSRCAQESGIGSIFSREQAQPQTLGCLIDFFLLMETTCRTENICKLLRSKEGAAITTGVEGRLFQGRVVLCPFPSVSRMFSFPWACCLSFFFFILKQEHSLGIWPTWTSLVKEMRVERVRGRGTGSVLNLCRALKGPKSPLITC